jgi:DME family drug/metabolite transporter
MTPPSPSKPASGSAVGVWQVVMGAALWGTTGTAQALAPAGAQPLVVGALRQVVGALGLLAAAAWRGDLQPQRLRHWPWRATLMAGLCMAVYQLSFFSAVARTGVAVGTVVGIGSAPIAGGLIAWWLRGERPQRRWAWSTALAIVGCALLAFSGQALLLNLLGLLLAITAGAAYALYAHFSKSMVQTQPADLAMAMVFGSGALLLLPVLWLYDWRWVWQLQGALVVLHLGLVTTAVAYALFARGLAHVSVATAMTLTLTEPLTAALLGLLLLGEPLTLQVASGLLCLLIGLAILTLRPST